MKKLGLIVMPIMAISFLTNCNKHKPLEECDWNEINEVSKAGKASEWFKVGDTKTVEVNGQPHRVRIIDFGYDDLADGSGKAGITFEFVDLISDKNGYSLATLWNDCDEDFWYPAYDYANSTLRKNLTGRGEGIPGWYEKGGNIKSKTYKTSVLEMLPESLRSNLKTVKKFLTKYNSETSEYFDYEVDDQMFLLNANEMNSKLACTREAEPYKYYENSSPFPAPLGEPTVVKRQVKGSDGAMTDDLGVPISDCKIGWDGYNLAGHNDIRKKENLGSIYWLCSPCKDAPNFGGNSSCHVCSDGSINDNGVHGAVYIYAQPIAPAFYI